MKKTVSKKIIVGLVAAAFIASIIVPSAVLLWPQKTEAQSSSCITGIISNLFSKILGGILGGIGGGGTVPVSDSSTESSTQTTSGYTGGSFVSDCIIKPMVKNLVKNLIHSFIMSITNWVNNGFNGSGPRFVSDTKQFFTDIANQAIGQVIQGTDLNFLCSPFKLDIKTALTFNFQGGLYGRTLAQQRTGCTLSGIVSGVQNAFMAGQWDPGGHGNGWQNWIEITTDPHNNPYGAYLLAEDEVDITIANQQFIAKTEADWGSGFLATKECVDPPGGGVCDPATGSCTACFQWVTHTPGTMLKDQISKAVGSPIDEYVNAEDMDALFGALMNQMIGQVFTMTGVFNPKVNNTPYYNQNGAGLVGGIISTSMPASMPGVNCTAASPTNPTSIQNFSSDGKTVQFLSGGVWGPPPQPISVADYQQAVSYCSYNPSWTAASAAVDSFINQINSQITTNQQNQQSSSGGVAVNQAPNGQASQSAPYTAQAGRGTPDQANNYIKTGCDDDHGGTCSPVDAARVPGAGAWWQVKLDKPISIGNIKIYKPKNLTYTQALGSSITVTISDSYNPANTKTITVPITDNDPIPIVVSAAATTGIIGDTVRISGGNGTELDLTEVEVYNYLKPSISVAAGTSNNITLANAASFNPLNGISATDGNSGLLITPTYTITDSTGAAVMLPISVAGTYTIVYTAADVNGVKSTPFTRSVTVQ